MHPLIRSNLAAISELCRRHGVRALYLVGSGARSDFDPSRSDFDFLVEFFPRDHKGFDDAYFVLLEDLSRLLQRHVDLIERHCVRNPYVLASMEREKVSLYAAA